MRIKILIVLMSLISFGISGQNYNENVKNFIGTFHTENSVINGLSVGLFPSLNYKDRFVKTNGIRLEIPGLGLLMPIGNGTEITGEESVIGSFGAKDYQFDEIVNGINLSSGTIGDVKFNGITFGLIGQYGALSNGISATMIMNAMAKTNGIQITGLLNENVYTNGIQLAIFTNTSVVMNGVQFGGNNIVFQEGYGLQIGVFNKASSFKGIQIGLWNKNDKRSSPIINWSFKS